MTDTRIRKNEKCVVGLSVCDYVFSSTRSCFIAYGFSTSVLEQEVLTLILKDRGIEPIEARGQLDPGKLVFCNKICSKIITSQFCIVLANYDNQGRRRIPNANVFMEYGLMLGHNKYVIPFQKDDDFLPFNVSGLDTIKYNQGNFLSLATTAIDQAIKETSQSQPASSMDQVVSLFLLIQNAILVDIQDPNERAVFQLGNALGFNYLNKFDGLGYVFLGNFGAIQSNVVIWRVSKLLELLLARRQSVPTRAHLGLTTPERIALLGEFFQRLEIWLIVNGENEEIEIRSWMKNREVPFVVKIFTLAVVTDTVSRLP